MKQILAILDEEEVYVRKLMEFFNHSKNILFYTVGFTDFTNFLEYERENEVAVLLCSESFKYELDKSTAKWKFLLTEESLVKELGEFKTIFKYQSAEEIMKEVLIVYSPTIYHNDMLSGTYHSEIIGVASPVGGTWCSSIATALSYFYGKKYKTLFISFDAFYQSKPLNMKSDPSGITESIYYLRQKQEQLLVKLSPLIRSIETFDYLVGCTHWADFTEVSDDEESELLLHLANLKQYDKIIIDFGGFYRSSAGLLKSCSFIYVPEFSGIVEKEKIKEWQRQYRLNSKDIDEQIRYISPPFDGEIARGNYSFHGLTTGVFGTFIKELVGDMEEGFPN